MDERKPGPFSEAAAATTLLEGRAQRLSLLLVLVVLIAIVVIAQVVQPGVDPSIPVTTAAPSIGP
jgi:hypothetical protein